MKAILTLLFLLCAVPAQAVTYWASVAGGAGTCGAASGTSDPGSYRTLAQGIACMSGGDTLVLKPGTYTNTGIVVPSGTAGLHTTIRADTTGTVTFTGIGSFNLYSSNVSYVDFVGNRTTLNMVWDGTSHTCAPGLPGCTDGIAICQTSVKPDCPGENHDITFDGVRITKWQGIAVQLYSQNNIFRYSRFDHNGEYVNNIAQAGYAFYVSGGSSGNIVEYSEIDNQGGFGIHNYSGYVERASNNIYRFNRVHHNGTATGVTNNADGILLDHGTGNQAYGNVVYSNRSIGIRAGNSSINALIYNNSLYDNGTTEGNVNIQNFPSASGTVIRNNIMHGGGGSFVLSAAATVSHNLCGPSACPSGSSNQTEALNTTFTNAAGANFTLKLGSLAINNGTTTGNPSGNTSDIIATPRPNGVAYDIGAYEFISTAIPVVTITGPTSAATYSTSSAAITVSGTSDLSGGVISWTCDRCTPSTGSTTTGTINAWTLFPALTLKAGLNNLTVTATSSGGSVGTDTIEVTYAPTFPGNTLALAMGFENGSGATVTDLSGNGNTGTLVGSPTWVGTSGGRYGNAVQFASTQHMTVADANSLDFTQSLTISMWVKPSASISTYSSLVAKVATPLLPPYRLFAGVLGECGTGGISGLVRLNGVLGPQDQACHVDALAANVWTHVAFTYDGTNLRLYKNGALMTTTPQAGYLEPSAGILYVARSEFGEYFAGAIDELRIYNFAIPRTTTNNATFGAACSAAEEIASPSVMGDANCPLVPLAPPLAFKVSSTSTIKLGADQTQKIGGTQP